MDRPADGTRFKEGEMVDADFLVDLLETFRFGKYNLPAIKNVLNATAKVTPATEQQDKTIEKQEEEEEEEDGSQGLVGNTSVHESIGSVSSSSDTIILDTMSETGSHNEPVSNEEPGYNLLESNSTDLPNVENERHQNAEEGEIVVVEEEKDKEEEENKNSNQNADEGEIVVEEEKDKEEEEEENKNSKRTSSESEEKSNLEKLLAMQENYELYCPSCSSCITRKVIIRKREHGKLVDLLPYESSEIEEIEPPVKAHAPEKPIENDDQEGKHEGSYILACLACLKYYIRLGTSRFLQRDYARGKPVDEQVEVHLKPRKSNTTESLPQNKPDRERFTVELLKSTVYGGLTETITSLVVVSSASASGSSTENILALAVANLAGGLIVLAQNLHDLRNNSDQEKDRYSELLGRRDNIRMHVLVAALSYIFFGLIAPLVYAFSFYQTGIKNCKLVSVFSVSLFCAIMLGMIKVYVRKPVNVRESLKPYLKSAAYYTSIVVVSSGISYIVGEIVGEYIRKLDWFSLHQTGFNSTFDGIKPEEYRFTSF